MMLGRGVAGCATADVALLSATGAKEATARADPPLSRSRRLIPCGGRQDLLVGSSLISSLPHQAFAQNARHGTGRLPGVKVTMAAGPSRQIRPLLMGSAFRAEPSISPPSSSAPSPLMST